MAGTGPQVAAGIRGRAWLLGCGGAEPCRSGRACFGIQRLCDLRLLRPLSEPQFPQMWGEDEAARRVRVLETGSGMEGVRRLRAHQVCGFCMAEKVLEMVEVTVARDECT